MQAKFILSAANEKQFIKDDRPKIIFSGRSNVGKSSVINRLCGQKNLARVGNSPGKTAHVNYFLIDDKYYFVDLPGYGYAKVSKSEKERWRYLIEAYFQDTNNINLGVMIVDIRHKPTELDKIMAEYFQQTCLPWVVVANKSDKLKASQISPALELIRTTLVLDESVSLIPFSCLKNDGKNILEKEIMRYGVQRT